MKIVKQFLLIISTLLVLMLAGCSGKLNHIDINTTLTVDKTFNGSRVMTADIPAAAYKYVFGGSLTTLEDVINQYTPGDMYCTASENENGGVQIQMIIDFASRNEYQKKIESICSGNTTDSAITPVINFDYSHSILKNGYTIEENFTSMDLFYWLADAIIKEYPSMGDKNIQDIFQLGKTEVVFDGETMQMDDYIKISTIQSNAFDSVSVAAQLADDQSIAAEITYVVSNKVVAALGTKLKSLMDTLVPADASMTYQDGNNSRTYTISFESATLQNYVTNVNKALHTSNTVFEVTTEGDTESLSAKKLIKQYYDGSYFLDFTDENTTMSYILKVSPEYTVESCSSTYGYLKDEASSYSSDTCEITMTVASADEVTAVLGFAVDIDEVDITTSVHSDTNIERTFEFRLSSDAVNLIGSSIEDRLNTAAEQWPDQMNVNKENILNNTTYSITLSANSADELTKMTRAVLGESGTSDNDKNNSGELTNSLFNGGTEKHKNPWNIHCSYEDTLNLSGFLKGSQIKNGIHYQLNYPKGFKATFTENNTFEDAAADGASITCSTFNKVLSVKSTAEKANFNGILIFGLWILSILCILVIALMNIGNIASLISNKKLDISGDDLFKGKHLIRLTLLVIAIVCFIFMTIRLIFRVY